MVRTAVNVSGDAVVSAVVAKSEGKLDLDVYNDPEAGLIHDEDLDIDDAVKKEIAETIQQTHKKS